MKKFKIDLEYGMTKGELEAFGVDMSIPEITWFLVNECFSSTYNNAQKKGLDSDQGVQYREIRLAFKAAMAAKEDHVQLGASDFNFMRTTVEKASLLTGLAFIKPVLEIALRDHEDVKHLKKAKSK